MPTASARLAWARGVPGPHTHFTARAPPAPHRMITCTPPYGAGPGPPKLRMQLQPGICPFPVLGFWGKITMPSAGIMTYRRDFPSTTRI